MLLIRKEQIDSLSDYMQRRFEDRMRSHLVDAFPAQWATKSDDEALELVRTGIQRAARHDIGAEYEVERYLDLMCRLSPTFDVDIPWMEKILTEPALSARAKMDRIYARLETSDSGKV